MAIKVNYEKGGDLYPGAYLTIQKIVGSVDMVENYEDQEDGTTILKYHKVPHHIANVFVYPDAESRYNNARPLHYFGIEFDYDPVDGGNIYTAAYTALKNVERFHGEIIEDII